MKRLSLLPAFVLALLAPLSALASDGFVTRDVSLRAGPDSDYPRITVIESGTPIEVLGCIDRWSWCDVVAYNERGWVFGRYVELEYQGRRGYVSSYGMQVGIPIIAFSLGTYWGSHYSDRDWYHHRDEWGSSSHGHRPNYTYATQYNSYGGSRRGTSTYSTSGGYRKSAPTYSTGSGYRAPTQSTTQRSTTYQQSRPQASGSRSSTRVVTQPVPQSSYTQERRATSRSSRNRTPAQDLEATRQERSTSNARGAQGPTRSMDKGQAGSNAREPQGPSRSSENSRHNRQDQTVERTEVARQGQPVAQAREKQGPQGHGEGQGHKQGKGEKNNKHDNDDDDKGKKDGKN